MDIDNPTNQLDKVITVLEKDKGIGGFWMEPAYAFNEIKSDYTDATLVTEENKFCLEHGFSTLMSELKFREPCYMVTENNMAVSVCLIVNPMVCFMRALFAVNEKAMSGTTPSHNPIRINSGNCNKHDEMGTDKAFEFGLKLILLRIEQVIKEQTK